LKTGTVLGYDSKYTDGDTFGEECLKDTETPADITAGEDCIVFLLKKETIDEFLDIHQKKTDGKAAHCENRSNIQFEDLENLGLLGEGSFGTVTMVKATLEDGTVECLALKRMGKNHLIEEDMLDSTRQEKDILSSLPPHPFVLRLFATYQDRDSVYMLTNLVQGGELYDYLHQRDHDRQLNHKDARFYTANIFLALSHLHDHGFVYRDLKPENVLIGSDGYLCLIDLGFAKACPYHILMDGEDVFHEQCFTTCGTPEYMAPEFIFQTGHDKGADYWALGCLVFEMFHGQTPFVNRAEPDDLSQIFVNIALHNNSNFNLPWKKGFADTEHATFILGTLQPRSVYRLGVVNKGKTTFMSHPWFDGFDWDKLMVGTGRHK
jgi:serine/threonine protein kinase